MDSNTEEVLKAIIKNTCIGIKEIAMNDKVIASSKKAYLLFEIDKIENSNLGKSAMIKLGILLQGIHNLVKDNSIIKTDDV